MLREGGALCSTIESQALTLLAIVCGSLISGAGWQADLLQLDAQLEQSIDRRQ